jgi:hypothetical protein
MKLSNTEKLRLARIQKEKNEKAEKVLNQHKQEYESGTLSRDILCKIPEEKQREYMKRVYKKKYKKNLVWEHGDYRVCEHCAFSGYFESDYASDDQIRYLCGLQSDLGNITYNYPEAAQEILKQNK